MKMGGVVRLIFQFRKMRNTLEAIEAAPRDKRMDPMTLADWMADAARATLAEVDPRPCTCHPSDNPPRPCPQRFALDECRKAAADAIC